MFKKEKIKLNALLQEKNIAKDLRHAEALILSGKVILNYGNTFNKIMCENILNKYSCENFRFT